MLPVSAFSNFFTLCALSRTCSDLGMERVGCWSQPCLARSFGSLKSSSTKGGLHVTERDFQVPEPILDGPVCGTRSGW